MRSSRSASLAATNCAAVLRTTSLSKRVDQFVEQLAVAEQEARFEDGGADGHVRLGLADALVHRAGGVADFQPDVPQAIENGFGDRLAPGGLLVGQQEQQIDVGARRQQAAAVAAGGDDRHVLGFGRILRRVEMLAREVEQQADDLVFQPADPLGAAAAVAVLEQQLLGLGAAGDERGLQPLRHRRAQFALVAACALGQLFQVGGDGARVDQFARRPRNGFGRRGDGGSTAREAMAVIGIAEAVAQVTARAPKINAHGGRIAAKYENKISIIAETKDENIRLMQATSGLL